MAFTASRYRNAEQHQMRTSFIIGNWKLKDSSIWTDTAHKTVKLGSADQNEWFGYSTAYFLFIAVIETNCSVLFSCNMKKNQNCFIR